MPLLQYYHSNSHRVAFRGLQLLLYIKTEDGVESYYKHPTPSSCAPAGSIGLHPGSGEVNLQSAGKDYLDSENTQPRSVHGSHHSLL